MKKFTVSLTFIGLLFTMCLQGQITYTLISGNGSWPTDKREAIIKVMDEAVAHYNRYGYFEKALTIEYNPDVPTADANYSGHIRFGGSISTRTALHEMAHTLGIGTTQAWRDGIASEIWSGARANARIVLYNGEGAQIKGDKWHFWSSTGPSYGLNFPKGDGSTNRIRHVKMVSAFRWDMGIISDSDNDGLPDDWETFYFQTLEYDGDSDNDGDGISNLEEYNKDKTPTSKFEWIKVDDRDTAVTYDNNWGEWPSDPSYNTTVNYSEVAGAEASFNFTGTKVRFYGFKRNDLGFADIYLNNELQTSIDCYATELHPDELLYESDSLEYGEYTLKVVVKGTKSESSTGTELIIDAFEYFERDTAYTSDTTTTTLSNTVKESANKLKIYPNPAKEFFTVESPEETTAKLSIFDTQGRLLYEKDFSNSIRVNENELAATGLLLIKLSTENYSYFDKIIME